MKALLMLVAAIILAAALAACNGGGDSDGDGGDGGTTVNVILQEWQATPDVESGPAGNVTFAAINGGNIPHQLLIAKTDLPPDALPMDGDGVVDVDAEGVELLGEIGEMEPTASGEVTLDLGPGKYVLFCNLPPEETLHGGHAGHYKQGVVAPFTVE